jgi:predicted nuclease with TOPRIM domain
MRILTALEKLLGHFPRIQFEGLCQTKEEYENIKWQIGLDENKSAIFGEPEFEIPKWEDVEKELELLKIEFEKLEYQRKRKPEYPKIEDQLDLLYHKGIDGWKEEIQKVKDKYPKPVVEEPVVEEPVVEEPKEEPKVEQPIEEVPSE